MVRRVPKRTCERVRYSFIVACLKYRTNFLKKILTINILTYLRSWISRRSVHVETISIMHSFSDVRAIHWFLQIANWTAIVSVGWHCLDGWFALVFVSVSTIICCKTLRFIKEHYNSAIWRLDQHLFWLAGKIGHDGLFPPSITTFVGCKTLIFLRLIALTTDRLIVTFTS